MNQFGNLMLAALTGALIVVGLVAAYFMGEEHLLSLVQTFRNWAGI